MSVIKPFKGWRPGVDIVQKLASRPYDVLNTEEARKECEDGNNQVDEQAGITQHRWQLSRR